MKRNKQIKRKAHVSMVDNVIYIRMILETFEASLSFKTNAKFDLVVDLIWLLASIWCPLNLYYHEPHLNYDPSRVNYEHALLSPDLPTNMLKFNSIINVFYEPHISHLWYMRSCHTHTNHPHLL